MNRVFAIFAGAFINVLASLYICGLVLNRQKTIFNKKNIFLILMASIILESVYLYTDSIIKIIFNFLLLSITCKLVFQTNTVKNFALSFIALMVSLISEMLYTIFIIFLFNIDITTYRLNFFGTVFTNFGISLIEIILFKIKFISQYLLNFINKIDTPKYKKVVLISLLSIFCLAMLTYYIYFEISITYGLILCVAFSVIYTFLTFTIFQEHGQNYKLQNEYNTMLKSLSEYEKLYSYQRILNHEFQNDLMVIRGMANQKNKKLLAYIDEISNFKNIRNEKWLNTLKRIPEGGLLGILYYKLLVMEDEKINISFEIGRNFKAKDYNLIEENLKLKICKLLGIYLDNAIQAVKKIDNKNISIKIDASDDFLLFTVANNFEGNIDLSRLYEKGYTTNGSGRGYGLTIAKEIFNQNTQILNFTKIIGNVFIQDIKIEKQY